MEEEKIRIWNISKKVFMFLGTLLILFLLCKFAVYFMPFFIAGILALLTEPIIKFNMNKLRMSRRMSSIIVVICTIIVILAITIWAGTWAVGKLFSLSKSLPSIIGHVTTTTQSSFSNITDDLSQYLSEDTIASISESLNGVLSNIGTYVQNAVTSLLKIAMSVPRIIVSVIITILAYVLFTKDRVNIINLIDFHFPEQWVKKGVMIKKEVFSTLGSYLKVYSKIIVITAIELMIAFCILNLIGFGIPSIIKLSIIIAIVDILPILGIGTVLIPWSIWCFIAGNTGLGIGLLVVYIVLTIIRQLIEPKLVSNQLGVHPLITLLAMYAGFKLVGFSGLILGPFALMVLRCVYAEQIKRGLFKSLVD